MAGEEAMIVYRQEPNAFYWQVSEACPVNVWSLAATALMMAGLMRVAVQVAVTCVVGEAERWMEGSLAVQFELTAAAVFAVHTPLPVNRSVEVKTWLFAGGAAV
jgi:hypothetical protein